MNTMERAARRVARTAGAAEQALREQVYQNREAQSKVRFLEGAADVLILLALYPLTTTGRIGFTALLERRIRRAYGGGQQ